MCKTAQQLKRVEYMQWMLPGSIYIQSRMLLDSFADVSGTWNKNLTVSSGESNDYQLFILESLIIHLKVSIISQLNDWSIQLKCLLKRLGNITVQIEFIQWLTLSLISFYSYQLKSLAERK